MGAKKARGRNGGPPFEIDTGRAFRLYRSGLRWREIATALSRLAGRTPPFDPHSVQHAVARDIPDYASRRAR